MVYTDKDFVVNNGIHTVGNTFVANNTDIIFNTNVTFTNTTTLIANGSAPQANQVLTSNSSGGLYWQTLPPAVNTLSIYTFSNTVTFGGNVVFANAISVNSSYGTSGQVLVYNGSNGYWASPVNTITANGALTKSGSNANPTVSLNAISPDPSGQFGLPAMTVDVYGRVTAASVAGSGGVLTMNSANTQLVSVTGTSGNSSAGFYGAITVNLANLYTIGTSTTFTGGQISLDTAGRIISGTNAFSSNVSFSNNYLLATSLKAFSEYVSNVTASSATTTLDLSTSNFFNVTLSSNTTLAFTNPPSGRVFSFNVVLTQDSVGGKVVTLPSSCKYPNGQTPVKTTTAYSSDIWTFTTYNGGTTYIASLSVKNPISGPI